MTVAQATTDPRVSALLDRTVREERHAIDRDLAFRLCVLRRWIARAGGEDIEFRTRDERGWMLTRRGRQVAAEEAERDS